MVHAIDNLMFFIWLLNGNSLDYAKQCDSLVQINLDMVFNSRKDESNPNLLSLAPERSNPPPAVIRARHCVLLLLLLLLLRPPPQMSPVMRADYCCFQRSNVYAKYVNMSRLAYSQPSPRGD
jgi:hypothetical protein